MKFRIAYVLILLCSISFFTSCEKENYDKIVYDDPDYEPGESYEYSPARAVTSGNNRGVFLACVQVDFPFSLKLENEQTVTINHYNDFTAAMNSTESKVLDFQYPVQGLDHLGQTKTFNNAMSLGTSMATCVPGEGWSQSKTNGTTLPAFLMKEFCVELNYPVNLLNGDGNPLMAENEIEFVQYSISNAELFFSLPLSVRYDQSNLEISNLDDMFDAFSKCSESNYRPMQRGANGSVVHPFDCFTFVYPFDVRIIAPDTLFTIDDEDELVQLSLSGADYEFVYPLEIEDEFGAVTTLNNDWDLIQVLVACDLITIDTSTVDPCDTEAHILLFFNGLNIFTLNRYEYDMNYPITLIVDGNPVVLNSDADYLPAIGGSPFSPKSARIQYPVSITQFGRTLVFNNDQDVCDFYATLDEDCGNKPAHIELFHNTVGVPISCAFYVQFPVNFVRNGVPIQVQDRSEYLAELNTPGAYDELNIVYPVTVEKVQNGQIIIFNSGGELCNYLDDCF